MCCFSLCFLFLPFLRRCPNKERDELVRQEQERQAMAESQQAEQEQASSALEEAQAALTQMKTELDEAVQRADANETERSQVRTFVRI